MVCGGPISADTLELRIVSNGNSSVVLSENPETIDIQIEGRLVAGDTDGLAIWGVNISATGDVDLCDSEVFLLQAPVGLSEFDLNEGLTNPPDVAVSGFSGTCDGEDGLWQIGGGQNTIGSTGPVLYPVGSVRTGVGNGGWTVLAEGTIEATQYTVLTLDTGYANTLDLGGGPDVYAVSDSPVTIVGYFTIWVKPICTLADVNCDGSVGFLDVAEVTSPLNWNKNVAEAANPRADVDGNGSISFLDVAEITKPVNWNTCTGPCTCD